MSYLLADIGNSTATLAKAGKTGPLNPKPLRHTEARFQAVATRYLKAAQPKSLAVVSVSEEALKKLRGAAADAGVKSVLLAGADFPVPVRNRTAKPQQTGIDRLLGALAAYRKAYHKACIVLDAGSAITVDLVDDKGDFLGGAILPGLGMAAETLASRTRCLPHVKALRKSRGLVGRSTEEAIRLGLWAATCGGAALLVDRYRRKLGENTPVFITGGNAAFFLNEIPGPRNARPYLVLEGLFAALREAFQKE